MNSRWFLIGQEVAAAMRAVATAEKAEYADNPAMPLDLQGRRARVLFVLNRGDFVVDQPGQRVEKRRLRVVVGATASTDKALADADRLHFAARTALRGPTFRQALSTLGDVGQLREVELEPELKEQASQGSALLSAFEIEYFQTYPNAA